MSQPAVASGPTVASRRGIVVAVGFMVFATFFGAGNLIFPPYLGIVGGSHWWIGFIAFMVTDTLLGVLGLAASGKFPQVELGVFYRPGRLFMLILGALATFFGSIIVVLPRTAATSYEVFLKPVMAGGYEDVEATSGLTPELFFFCLAFFGLATLAAVRPTKVVDIVGRVLTPILLVLLVVLIVVGLTGDHAGVRPYELPSGQTSLFAFGLVEGLQTFDASTGTIIAVIIITSLMAKGIRDSNSQTRTILQSGVVAGICLLVVYLGLTLLGVVYSNDNHLMALYNDAQLDRTYLLNYIIGANLGFTGTVIMGLVVLVATFTTAIGCVSLTAQYYCRITGGRLRYPVAVVIGMALAFAVALFSFVGGGSGVEFILSIAYPLIVITAPITIVLVVLNLFSKHIPNDNVYRAAALVAGLCGTVTYFAAELPGLAQLLYGDWNVIAPYGFHFVIPTAVACVIAWFIKWKGFEERPYLREHAGDDDFDFAALKAKKAAARER